MSQGPSGRIVVELEPETKRQLYQALTNDGLTFKHWLLRHIVAYLTEPAPPPLLEAKISDTDKQDMNRRSP